MSALEARGIALGETARARAVQRLADRLRAELPEVALAETADGVTLTGRGLLRDPRLVWIGSMLR